MTRTLAERLTRTRRRALLGRDEELRALRQFLESPDEILTYVHGPGGVGKSTLLDLVIADARAAGRTVCSLDCAELEPTAARFAAAIRDGLGDPMVPAGVLVVDRFELLSTLTGWFWRTFLPSLPIETKIVLASRRPPPESWRTDAVFAECVRVLPVRNLTAGAAAALARARGVTADADVAELVRATRGHPLAIMIATDGRPVSGRASGSGVLIDHPDMAARLLGRFLDEGVTQVQRDALHVCGHARRVDRAMLRVVLDIDDAGADELLEWIRERPYAESHPDGLTLHDVVRDALEHDLRWRDRDAFVALHTRIRGVIVDRMTRSSPSEHPRWAADLVYLNRGNPDAHDMYEFADLGSLGSRPLRPGDPDDQAWVAAAFAVEHRSTAVRYWARTQPEALTVFQDSEGHPSGACLIARLDRAGPDLAEHDPVAAWVLRELARRRPPEPGEPMIYEAAVYAGAPGRTGALADQVGVLSLRAWSLRGLGWVVASSASEESWVPIWNHIGFERLGACTVEDVEFGLWGRDFARSPYPEWLAGMAAKEIDNTGTVPAPLAAPVALARADFGDAVRRLLRDLHDPVRLRASPLADSRLAGPDPDRVGTLQLRVRQAVATLAQTPRTELAARALDRTYLRPAGSQEKAAELLGSAFSTYRRHLAAGTKRLEDLLWDWELHGPPTPGDA